MLLRSKKSGDFLLASASVLVLAMAGSAAAQEANKLPGELVGDEDIIVTGTRIRGVAAIGSATIPLDRETIQERATASTNDILRDVPQITNFGASGSAVGGPQVQNSSLNNTYANSINLRGLGTSATLTLVDGHRVAPSGGGGGYTDVDMIPAIAIERIEVVADGSSAIYGSDAVAGVVNLRIREPFSGAETSIGAGLSDGTHTFKASQLFGYRGSRAGILVALEHSTQSSLSAAARPNLYNDDLTPYGGAPSSNQSFPGNVSSGVNVFAIPAGQNGQGFTLAKLGPANLPNLQSVWLGVDALPSQERNTALAKYDWEITDNLKFFGYGVYTERDATASLTASSSAGYTVPSTNPFSPCRVGVSRTNTFGVTCAANGSLSVIHSWYNELGNEIRNSSETAMNFTNGFELKLPSNWKTVLAGTYGKTKNVQVATTVNNNAVTALLAAPGATVNVTVPGQGTVAVTHPLDIPSLNLFCGTTPCNDPASLAYISASNGNEAESIRKDFTLGADGPLFSLPGGDVRIAVGAEYRHDKMSNDLFNLATTATVTSPPRTLPTSSSRSVKSVFGELFVPIVGADNAMPFIRRLDLSLAARYDDYSDFGSTVNPKFGLAWMPTDSLTLHASYGTSFRAPTLADSNPLAGANIIAERAVLGSQLTGGVFVNTTNYAALTTIGGHAGLNPETAETFSLGFEFKPPTVSGLLLSVNYYNLTYKNRIETPANSAGFPANLNASPLYDSFFVYNPSVYPTRATLTQAQFNALLAAKLASTAPAISRPPASSTVILALIDGTRANSGSLSTEGLDLQARYSWENALGKWNIGVTGTYVINYLYSPVQGAPALDYVNTFSTIGSPLRFRGRGQIGWSKNGFSATGFVNYQNSYNFPNGVNFPINLVPAGITAANYGKIKSHTKFDLAMSYDTRDAPSLLKDISFRVYVTNLFDKDPPFVINGTVQYDPTQASQVGRTVSLQITKKW